MKKSIYLISIVLIVMVFVSLFLIARWNNHTTSVSSSEVAFTHIRLADDSLNLSGSLLSSAKSYRGFTYTIEKDTLYLTLSQGMVNRKYPDGDFTIAIEDQALEQVSAIYLKSGSDIEQIDAE